MNRAEKVFEGELTVRYGDMLYVGCEEPAGWLDETIASLAGCPIPGGGTGCMNCQRSARKVKVIVEVEEDES